MLATKSNQKVLSNVFNDTFNFLDISEQNGVSSITSDPRGVCFCDKDKICKEFTRNLTIFPGQTFNVSVAVIGQLNGSTVGIIDANIVDDNPTMYSTLVSENRCNKHSGCVNLTYTLCSNQTDVKLNFTTVIADLNTYHDPVLAALHVSFLRCPYGFALSEIPPYSCECSPMFDGFKVQCDINTQVIQVCIPAKSSKWFGCDKHDNNSVCYPSKTTGCHHYCNQTERCVYMTNGMFLTTNSALQD